MTWQVVYRDRIPDDQPGWSPIGTLIPWTSWPKDRLAPESPAARGERPPLVLILPRFDDHAPAPGFEGQPFCIDSLPTSGGTTGWNPQGVDWPLVDGQAVPLTLTPSVSLVGSYHGFVQAGVITDDVDGRG